jgi:hypothetical protein
MILAAALISLATLPTSAERQPAQSDASRPYTLSGVRRASNVDAQPAADSVHVSQRGPGFRLAVETKTAACSTCDLVVTSGPSWATPTPPTWHDQFLGMSYPVQATPSNSMAGNRDRVTAVATSIGFALAFQGVARLVQKIAGNVHQERQRKTRSEIDAELAALERLNRASRQADPGGVRK